MINSIDKFKMCREFIIMINSDVFKNLLRYNSKLEVELMLQNSHGARFAKTSANCSNSFCHFHLIWSVSRPQRPLIKFVPDFMCMFTCTYYAWANLRTSNCVTRESFDYLHVGSISFGLNFIWCIRFEPHKAKSYEFENGEYESIW
jgi:hypothetical protein